MAASSSSSAAVQDKPPADAPHASPVEVQAAAAEPQFIAVAWLPELREPMLLEIMGGGFGVTFPATDETLFLHPGTNKVRRDLWQRARLTGPVQEQIRHRTIVEIEIGDTDGGDPDGNMLHSLKEVEKSAALQLISFARFTLQLQRWHDLDDRMEVRAAIMRRIKELNEGSEV